MASKGVLLLKQFDKRLPLLYDALTSKGVTAFKLLGEVRCALDHKLDREFVLDEWPDFRAVVARPGPSCHVAYLDNVYTVYGEDRTAVRALLAQAGVVTWHRNLSFSAVPEDLVPVLTEEASKHGGHATASEATHTLVLEPGKWRDASVPQGLEVTPMKPEEAAILQAQWKFSSDSTLQFHRWTLENFKSLCVRSAPDQPPLGYVTEQWFGSMGACFVEPGQRGRGLGKVLYARLARLLLDDGRTVYTHTETDNAVSMALQRTMGAEIRGPAVHWVSYDATKYNVKTEVKTSSFSQTDH